MQSRLGSYPRVTCAFPRTHQSNAASPVACFPCPGAATTVCIPDIALAYPQRAPYIQTPCSSRPARKCRKPLSAVRPANHTSFAGYPAIFHKENCELKCCGWASSPLIVFKYLQPFTPKAQQPRGGLRRWSKPDSEQTPQPSPQKI